MFGFFPVFFARSARFCLASAAWSSCGITGSMFAAIGTVSAASGSVMSSVCNRDSTVDSISRGMGAAVLLAAALASAGAGRAKPPIPASAVPAPTPLTKSRRVSFIVFLLRKFVDMPCSQAAPYSERPGASV